MIPAEHVARDASSVEEALERLHAAGLSPIDAVKALRTGRGITLREAKAALHASSAWFEEARAAERLHDEIIEATGAQPADDPGSDGGSTDPPTRGVGGDTV